MKTELSINAKLLYGLLLNRTMLSQHNDWLSPEGNVYIIYTISQMAEDLNRSQSTIKTALNELESSGLIQRQRQGCNKASHIFVLLPSGQNSAATEGKSYLIQGSKFDLCSGQNLASSNTDTEYKNNSNTDVVNIRKAYGRFKNVFLYESEIANLQAAYPAEYEEYIERLSSYMKKKRKKLQ